MASVTRAAKAAATFVTTLPSSPIDGQEVFYQSTTAGTGGGATNSMADVGAVWHLRYRAASSSSYKWEAVGAAPFIVSINDTVGESTAATHSTYQSLTTPLTFVAAEKGDYCVTIGCEAKPTSTAGQGLEMSYKIGTTLAVEADRIVAYTPASSTQITTSMRNKIKDLSGATIAERTLTAQFRSGGSSAATFYNRSLGITPIRVG